MNRLPNSLRCLAAGLALAAGANTAGAAGFTDALVQAPEVAKPERGSVVGSLSKLSFGPADLLRGSFSLPSPFELPGERGSILAKIFPTYSPETGLSEWGVGWQGALRIHRFRAAGDIDYAADEFSSPWGRLVEGESSGDWYVTGLRGRVRLRLDAGNWIAILPDGTKQKFEQRVETDAGTFAWYLTEVVTPLGDSTTLSYETNASGRPFLAAVEYGNRANTDTYRVTLSYETLAEPFSSYASGQRIVLDRRVSGVLVESRSFGTGSFQERWHYDIGYDESPSGPAYFMSSVQKVYATGDAEPPITYEYDLGTEAISDAAFEHIAGLDEYLGLAGSTGLSPDNVTIFDVENDGMLDLEHYYSHVLLHQTESGWSFEFLPPAPPWVDRRCRPKASLYNDPRSLVRMIPEEAEPQVVVAASDAVADTTDILVCSRDGAPKFEVTVGGIWELGRNTRLADVNRDNKPDIVAVLDGEVRFLQNVSDGTSYGFEERDPIELSPVRAPDSSWIYDVNADGRQDLIVRSMGEGKVYVWYGTGNFGLDPNGQELTFHAGDYDISSVSPFGMAFVDANKDGLLDILLSEDTSVRLFMNRGSHQFDELAVDGLDGLGWDTSNPLIADMSGNGNTEIVYTSNKKAYALALNGPETGLMRRVDDGQGTVIDFGYVRAPAWAGVGHRPSVLDSLTVASSGYDTVTYQYGYENPVMHSQGRYLVGYSQTQKLSPILSETVSFYNDDDISGIVAASYQTDSRTPGLMKFTTSDYDEVLFDGVRIRRASFERSGWRRFSDLVEVAMDNQFLEYDHGLCPTSMTTNNGYGTLLRDTVLADLPGLDGALHCMQSRETLTGSHADGSLDFSVAQRIERNSLGQVTRVVQEGGGAEIEQQSVTYDGYGRPVAIASPGHGARTIEYDSQTGVVTGVVEADGSAMRASELDPVTGAITKYQVDRGPGGVLTSSYRYDGMERLSKAWQDFGGSSEALPQATYSYQFASYDEPGAVIESALVQSSAYKQTVALTAADGETVAEAERIPEGWSLRGLTRTVRNDRAAYTYLRSPIGSDVAALAYDDLFEGADMVGSVETAGFGHETLSARLVQDGVVHSVATEVDLSDAGEVITTVTENGARTTRSAIDARGKTLWIEDADGVRTTVLYDAMDRIVGVRLADGTEHRVWFDAFGRPSKVDRPGVASIEYTYDAATGLVTERKVLDSLGAIERREAIAYDAIGRISSRTHTLELTGEQRRFSYRYDGERSGAATVPGQLGNLTEVSGDAFRRRIEHNPDGSVRSTEVEIADWRSVRQDNTYNADGSLASVLRTVTDLQSGESIEEVEQSFVYDATGRLSELRLNGATLASLIYDGEGRIAQAELPGGNLIALHYDGKTRELNGYWHDNGDWNAGVDWQIDAFGQVSVESYSVNAETWDRSYVYDARGFLTEALEGGTPVASYAYDALGMPTAIEDVEGARDVTHYGDEMDVGADLYVFDPQGRVVQKGDVSFTYGPDGQLARADIGSDVIELSYDEAGNRILKRNNGAPVAGYVGAGYLDADGFVEPVKLGGRLIGVIAGGSFELIAADPRGTLFADRDGTANLASPYGVRSTRPELAAALDFVEKGYDADLGTVRMGVRDYDPRASQFLTPDPLFLESVNKCASSPVECNLYAYSGNDPINFSDPSGMERKPKTWDDAKKGDKVGTRRLGPRDKVMSGDVDTTQAAKRAEAAWNGTKYKHHYWKISYWSGCWEVGDCFRTSNKTVPKIDLEKTRDFISDSFAEIPTKNDVGRKLSDGVSARLVLKDGVFLGWNDVQTGGAIRYNKGTSNTKTKSTTKETSAEAGLELGVEGVGKVGFKGGAKESETETETDAIVKGKGVEFNNTYSRKRAVIRGELYIEFYFKGGGISPDHVTRRVKLGSATILYQVE